MPLVPHKFVCEHRWDGNLAIVKIDDGIGFVDNVDSCRMEFPNNCLQIWDHHCIVVYDSCTNVVAGDKRIHEKTKEPMSTRPTENYNNNIPTKWFTHSP